jgi:hypothetical protein
MAARPWRKTFSSVHPGRIIEGRVSNMHFMGLNPQPEFVPIHEQPNHNIVHLNRLGEADGLACQSLRRFSEKILLC